MKGIKTGGREQGTPNRITKSLREILADFLNDNVERVKKDFDVLEPKDRVKMYLYLLQYSIPKIKEINLPIEEKKTPRLIIVATEETKELIERLNSDDPGM